MADQNDVQKMMEELDLLSARLKEIEQELRKTLERISKLVQELPPPEPPKKA